MTKKERIEAILTHSANDKTEAQLKKMKADELAQYYTDFFAAQAESEPVEDSSGTDYSEIIEKYLNDGYSAMVEHDRGRAYLKSGAALSVFKDARRVVFAKSGRPVQEIIL